MMIVFFIGIGLASIVTGFASTPLQVGSGLFVVGMFAAIYHPVGLAIVTAKWKNTGMRIAVNGVWGNLGVACAALLTGFFIDHGGWRVAFVLPGLFSVAVGLGYLVLRHGEIAADRARDRAPAGPAPPEPPASVRALLFRVSAIVFLTTAVSSTIFQSTTFALPKIFAERLTGLAEAAIGWLESAGAAGGSDIATLIGSFAFIVFAVASLAQVAVGASLDRFGPRTVFMTVAAIQILFFAIMPGTSDALAMAVALGFTIGAFGQIPINDFMIGKMASGAFRARVFGVRYVVSFTVLAATLPLIAFVHETWGFDVLFMILAVAALIIFAAVLALPRRLPTPEAAAA